MVARARAAGLVDRQPVPPFYIYEHPALDFSWMRERCAAFDQLRRQAYNERLGEVAERVIQRPDDRGRVGSDGGAGYGS